MAKPEQPGLFPGDEAGGYILSGKFGIARSEELHFVKSDGVTSGPGEQRNHAQTTQRGSTNHETLPLRWAALLPGQYQKERSQQERGFRANQACQAGKNRAQKICLPVETPGSQRAGGNSANGICKTQQ